MTLRINARHSTADHPLDAYWTCPQAVRALMALERLPKSIADPCCGSGVILDVLEAAGHVVHGADVVDYGWRCTVIRDYLAEPVEMNGVGIVTNPPFCLAKQFIRKAISDGCRFHAWLLRTNFLKGAGRQSFWEENPPNRIWQASLRLPNIHRHEWTGPKVPNNVAYMWAVWDAASTDQCKLGWFNWRGFSP